MAKVTKSNLTLEEEKELKKEIKKLKKIFSEIEENKLNLVSGLIEQAAFMNISLSKLKAAINEKGMTEKYKNGENQYGTKKSPEVEIYNTMIKNYSSVIKQLCELLPQDKSSEIDDGFMDFVKK